MKSSLLWVPCNAIMSEADQEQLEQILARHDGDLDAMEGETLRTLDNIRLVPDILTNGDNYFFPVFTSCEEMGEYGDHFSKLQKHIMEIIPLARNNEKDVCGIVVNAFTEPFVLDEELFEIIENSNQEE